MLDTRSTLARSTLLKMGARIAVIIVLTTLVSYHHIFNSFRTETLTRMERSVTERSQKEQAIFVLAEDNHAVLKKALAARFQAWSTQNPNPRFEALFAHLPDGTLRNNPRDFDGTWMPGVFVPPGVKDDVDFRRRLVASYEVVAQYGPAFHTRFTDTGVMLPEGVLVGYWPEGASWFKDVEPTFSLLGLEYFTQALPRNNPKRESLWTGIFEDTPSKTWMVTVSTPLDINGQHVATLSHDVLLNELMSRTVADHLPGAYNILFRDDGQLIAHPELKPLDGGEPYNILNPTQQPEAVLNQVGSAEQRAHLRAIFERVKARAPGQTVVELPEYDEYLAVGRLTGPDWNFVTVMPERLVSSAAIQSSRYVLAFGVLSLLLELVMMSWVLRQQIAQPLLAFTQATSRLAAGDFQVALNTSRRDELGKLASAFQHMAGEVQRREDALRHANEDLEQRVEQRTRELKDMHRQFVETARQVGRAEIATNVLHNVGNVLNSVQTSAIVARDRLDRMKVENVERVAALFEEHRADLGTYLSEDPQGRNTLPFLKKLGEHMRTERQEIRNLLDDVNRHTEHIGAIVKLQQRYARVPHQLYESVRLRELVDDALRINQAGLGRHAVEVVKELADVPPLPLEKHKVLMILVNLISNAKYAMDAIPANQRLLHLKLEQPAPERIRLEVRDNGMGIAPEMLTRIFQYGFTTREEGHGFGLHSSALAAQELGGSLTVHSEGPGRGATFVLELPIPGTRSEQAHA